MEGGADPVARTVAVSNAGGGTLNFTADADVPWLSVSPDAGTAPADVRVAVSLDALAAGTHTGLVTVDSGPAGRETIAVRLTVAERPAQLALSTASLSFTAVEAGGNPVAQAVAVTNGDGGTLGFTATSDVAWLTATPTQGSAPANLSVVARADGLTAGTYTGHVTVAAAAAGTTSITVTLTVSERPAQPLPVLAVGPAALSLSGTQGGGDPAPATIVVMNSGAGSLSFTAVTDAGWLSVTPHSGAAPANLTVAADLDSLAPGTHTGHVTVDGGAAGAKRVTVTLEVDPPASSGLVGAWSFDESSGATATDSSGESNHGMISGAARATTGRAAAHSASTGSMIGSRWPTAPLWTSATA